MDPAGFAEFQGCTVGLAFVIDCDEGGPLWGDAELVGVTFEFLAVWCYSIGDFVGGVELKSQTVHLRMRNG